MTVPTLLVLTDGNLYGYFHSDILRIHLAENPRASISVFRLVPGVIIRYVKISCVECLDEQGDCQKCCPHDEHDHGICLDCGLDRADDLSGIAESTFEGDR